MNQFVQGLKNDASRLTLTENGATAYNTTNSPLVDLFSTVGSLRTRSELDIEMMFAGAFMENPLLATKLSFYSRNIRGGLGERRTSRIIWKFIATNYAEIMAKNIVYVPFFGRWDDLYSLIDTPISNEVWSFIRAQWNQDVMNHTQNKPISLMSKWLATPDTSNAEKRRLGRLTARKLDLSLKDYTKGLRIMRKHLDVVEVKMTNQDWDTIVYSQVPSRSMMNYRNAFQRHNPEGFSQYLQDLTDGKTKVNAGTLYPYDLMEKMDLSVGYSCMNLFNYDSLLQQQWNSLPNYIEGEHNVLVMADTSGSMDGRPMATSVGLSLYFAERNKGAFANMFMTFSSKPSLVELKGKTLAEKVQCIPSIVENTDLQLAFQLILSTALQNNVPSDDMPKSLIVVSDMEIDHCGNVGNGYISFYDNMKKKFSDHGYQIPNVVFWNVNSRNNVFHADSNIPGVQMVSGQSVSTFKTVLNSINKTVYEAMIETLSDSMYDAITI